MTPENILKQVSTHRVALTQLLVNATELTQKIHAEREAYKVTEDMVVAEIWANESFKNDRVRNEQKHLAKINDERLTSKQFYISSLELDKARLHANILTTQNLMNISTIQYQAAMVNQIPDVQFKLVPVEVQHADTTREIITSAEIVHEAISDEPASMVDRSGEGWLPAAQPLSDEDIRTLIDEDTAAMPDRAGDHQAKK